MIYQDIHAARFLARPNRFIAQVELEGRVETVHVKNTGRCKELLLPGCTVYLEGSSNPARRTKYDLVAVEKVRPGLPPLFINMDSQAPNKVFAEWMTVGLGEALGFPRPTLLRPETTWGNSRFDFYWEESGAASMESPCQPGDPGGPFPVRRLLGENGRFTRNVRSAKGLCGGQGLHLGGKRPGPLPRRPHGAGGEAPAGAYGLPGGGL